MKMAYQGLLIILTGLVLLASASCSLVGGQTSSTEYQASNVGMLQPKSGKALLFIASSLDVTSDVAVLVGDKQVGSLSMTRVLAVHLYPGDYMVRSSYQDGFPVEVTLRKGESLLVQAQNTERGLNFKPVRFENVREVVAGRKVHEVNL